MQISSIWTCPDIPNIIQLYGPKISIRNKLTILRDDRPGSVSYTVTIDESPTFVRFVNSRLFSQHFHIYPPKWWSPWQSSYAPSEHCVEFVCFNKFQPCLISAFSLVVFELHLFREALLTTLSNEGIVALSLLTQSPTSLHEEAWTNGRTYGACPHRGLNPVAAPYRTVGLLGEGTCWIRSSPDHTSSISSLW